MQGTMNHRSVSNIEKKIESKPVCSISSYICFYRLPLLRFYFRFIG